MINKLKLAIQALAQTAEIQIQLFPDFVNVADELALSLEEALIDLKRQNCNITDEQMNAIFGLDNYIASLSGDGHLEIWTEEALRESPEWKEIRKLAAFAAEKMGWPIVSPGPNSDIYVG